MADEKEVPRIGDTVYYYAPGNTQQAVFGQVLSAWNGDLVNVAVWEVGRLIEKKSINRRGSDALKNNPAIEQMSGSWDYRDAPEVRKAMRELVEMAMKPAMKPKVA